MLYFARAREAEWKELSRTDWPLIALFAHVRIELCPLSNGAARQILSLESQLQVGEQRTARVQKGPKATYMCLTLLHSSRTLYLSPLLTSQKGWCPLARIINRKNRMVSTGTAQMHVYNLGL